MHLADHTVHSAVVTYSLAESASVHSHEIASRATVGRARAALKGCSFEGEYDPGRHHPGRVYLVPNNTLVSSVARQLGVHTEDDLFGGVVPYPFVATKTITHPLIDPEAFAPAGWSPNFPKRVGDVVLPGFSAFTLRDAHRAGTLLLTLGPARLKLARGIGGRGQVVVSGPAELEAVLGDLDSVELERHGVVVEQNLTDVTTASVGQVRVAGLVATYCGRQRLTSDNVGETVYGGSDLIVVRGDYEALLELNLTPAVLLAVTQARRYDAATVEFPGLFASRRNYDVAQGFDALGNWCSGVLEQSWRFGGASGPEAAALQAFRADPELSVVRAWCLEVFGESEEPPGQAIVHFRGVDERIGPMTKYTLVQAHEPARGNA